MSAHTPGPWSAHSRRCNAALGSPSETEIRGGANGNMVVARLGLVQTDRHRADVRLIAAAPFLLEALRDVLNAHSRNTLYSGDHWARARAAVEEAMQP